MITAKLKKLAEAMAEFEGWLPESGAGGSPGPGSVSYRNHNPGNLRRSPFALGQRDGFAYFLDDNVGFFALVWDLWAKANSKTSTTVTGESTIKDLIYIWTTDPEPIKEKYIQYIEKRTGLSRDMKLKKLING
jgi:hypothetical protein